MKPLVGIVRDQGRTFVVVTRYRNSNLRQHWYANPTPSSLARLRRLGYLQQ